MLGIFLTRLFRLFPRFEWLAQRRELKTDEFEKQPLLDCSRHLALLAILDTFAVKSECHKTTCRSIYQRIEFSVTTAPACGMSENLVYSK